MQIQRYIYAGTPGGCKNPLKFIEDTPESRLQAIEEGYTAFSTMSFAHEPSGKKKPEPVHYGDLWLDIGCKEVPFLAVVGARDFVNDLVERYKGANPEMLDYFMSGSKPISVFQQKFLAEKTDIPAYRNSTAGCLNDFFNSFPLAGHWVCWRKTVTYLF